MTKEEAVKLLGKHSGRINQFDDDNKTGFLGMLRPYEGRLCEENYLQLLEIIELLETDLTKESISREIMSDLWAICFLGKAWGVDPDGMLRRNDLIDEADVKKLCGWVDSLSIKILMLLDNVEDK